MKRHTDDLTVPHKLEAERAVLGACILDDDACAPTAGREAAETVDSAAVPSDSGNGAMTACAADRRSKSERAPLVAVHCANPDCTAVFEIRRPHQKRYCSARCRTESSRARRAAKLQAAITAIEKALDEFRRLIHE